MDKNRSANPNIKEFVGRKRPVTQVMVVAVFVPQLILMFKWWGKMSGSHIGIMLILMVLLLLIVLKISPRFEPQKKIRFGQNTLAMYQDKAIHWHIPYSDIDRFTINRREHIFLNRANMLNVFNGEGDQLIEQDVEFLSADQRTLLLGLVLFIIHFFKWQVRFRVFLIHLNVFFFLIQKIRNRRAKFVGGDPVQ